MANASYNQWPIDSKTGGATCAAIWSNTAYAPGPYADLEGAARNFIPSSTCRSGSCSVAWCNCAGSSLESAISKLSSKLSQHVRLGSIAPFCDVRVESG